MFGGSELVVCFPFLFLEPLAKEITVTELCLVLFASLAESDLFAKMLAMAAFVFVYLLVVNAHKL